jgi:hypothetical protein
MLRFGGRSAAYLAARALRRWLGSMTERSTRKHAVNAPRKEGRFAPSFITESCGDQHGIVNFLVGHVDEVRSGSSYISQSDLRVHFGLGIATRIDYVEVRWPSGLVERFADVQTDGIRSLIEDAGAARLSTIRR